MGNLLQELKRRKVFRVAAAYAVVAWVLIQVSGEVLPTFGAPLWVQQTITFLFFLGFPITLVVAWAYEVTPEGVRPDSGIGAAQSSANSTDRILIYIVLALVSLLGVLQITDRFLMEPGNTVDAPQVLTNTIATSSGLSRRSSINLGPAIPFTNSRLHAHVSLSNNGRDLVYRIIRPTSGPEVGVRSLDQLDAQLLPHLDTTPSLSPDGEWAAFWRDGRLVKAQLRGGGEQVLADSVRSGTGPFWGHDGFIYFTSDNDNTLIRVGENGGAPEALGIPLAASHMTQSFPYLIPRTQILLYSVRPFDGYMRNGRVDLFNLETGEVTPLIDEAYNARYVPTGHIVFIRHSNLWAVPFDVEQLQITGSEVQVIAGVATGGSRGNASYDFSEDGLLVYLPGSDTGNLGVDKTLVWVDESGNEEALPLERNYMLPRLSPDGQRLAASIGNNEGNTDIWIYDLARNGLSRLSFDELDAIHVVWTPDSERVIYRKAGRMWWRAADGTGQEQLLRPDIQGYPWSVTPDGSQLLYWQADDIYLLNLNDDSDPQLLLASEFIERVPTISPDGQWMAYFSDESGILEIYVRPFPDVDAGKYQISFGGGEWAEWHPSGDRLYFRRANQVTESVWAVDINTENGFQYSAPEHLFSGEYYGSNTTGGFDVAPDGSRFLMIRRLEDDPRRNNVELVLVDNWFDELKRLAPADPQ